VSSAGLCPVCQTALGDEAPASCPTCGASYHSDCWQENGGCGVYGCRSVPPTEARRDVEIPAGYWGQETKPCPACGTSIVAAAVRCRNCGATFAGQAPLTAHQYRQRQAVSQRLPSVRRATIALFALALLPCSAPIAALALWLWLGPEERALAALPPLYGAMRRLGIVVGAGQAVVLALAMVLYAVTR
jgi:hypothetical protein